LYLSRAAVFAMADNKDSTEQPTTDLKEKIAEQRRGSMFDDETKRRASVAQLTANTTGECVTRLHRCD
jgi:hypothetical protein